MVLGTPFIGAARLPALMSRDIYELKHGTAQVFHRERRQADEYGECEDIDPSIAERIAVEDAYLVEHEIVP